MGLTKHRQYFLTAVLGGSITFKLKKPYLGLEMAAVLGGRTVPVDDIKGV